MWAMLLCWACGGNPGSVEPEPARTAPWASMALPEATLVRSDADGLVLQRPGVAVAQTGAEWRAALEAEGYAVVLRDRGGGPVNLVLEKGERRLALAVWAQGDRTTISLQEAP